MLPRPAGSQTKLLRSTRATRLGIGSDFTTATSPAPGSRIIAIAGGSGSGKSALAGRTREQLGRTRCTILSQDSYYRDMSANFDHDGGAVNFDHPDSLEFSLLTAHLAELKAGRRIQVPRYDFATHSRLVGGSSLEPTEFVLVDGILILTQPKLRALCDHIVFVEATEQVRFERRLARDVEERGRTAEGVKAQWQKQVQPMHIEFVERAEFVAHADQVLSGEADLDESSAAVVDLINKI